MTESEPQCPECSRMLSSLLLARLEHETAPCPDCGTQLRASEGVPVVAEDADSDASGGPPAVPEEALAAAGDARAGVDAEEAVPGDVTTGEVTQAGADVEVATVDPSRAGDEDVRPGVATDPAELEAAATAPASDQTSDQTSDTTLDPGSAPASDQASDPGSVATPEVAATAEEVDGTPDEDPLRGWDDADQQAPGGADRSSSTAAALEGAADLVREAKVDPVTAGAFAAVGAVLGALLLPGGTARGLFVGGLAGAATAWLRGTSTR